MQEETSKIAKQKNFRYC